MTTIGALLPPPKSNILVRMSSPTLPPPTLTSVPCSGPFTTGSARATRPNAAGINAVRAEQVHSFIGAIPHSPSGAPPADFATSSCFARSTLNLAAHAMILSSASSEAHELAFENRVYFNRNGEHLVRYG